MTEGTGQAIDPSGEARSVLQSAVTDYGARVLSNAAILDGICEDRLPEWPREASLVSMAARADVAAMLQQQAGGVGPDTAVRLTAASLADSTSIDPSAAIWVVGEFARALGYQVSEGLRPAAGTGPAAGAAGAAGAAVPAAAVPAPPPPGPPPPPPPSSPPASPGEDLTVPPAAGLPHPPTQQVGFGQQETRAAGQGTPQAGPPPGPTPGARVNPNAPGGYGWVPPPAPPLPGGGMPGAMPPGGMPPPPAGGGKPRQGMVLGIGAAALAVVYFIVAGVAGLPPFGKSTPTPSPTPPASTSPPRPSPTVTTFVPTAGDLTLESLIPANVSANHSCTPVQHPAFGATAEMHCSGASIPPGYVQYYLFANTNAMNAAYSTFIADFAKTSKNTGPCHTISGTSAFNSFAPCETQFSISSVPKGRIAEYLYKGDPDISCTFTVDKVLVDMAATSGSSLIHWWDHSRHWINS